MDEKPIPLSQLPISKKGRIIGLDGGQGFKKKLRAMGIKEGQIIKVVTKQPFRGPVTIAFFSCQMTLGRGMADKITVEVI